MDNIITRKCTKCGKEKTIEQFHLKKAGSDGRSTECKSCLTIRGRKWRLNHMEQSRGYTRKYKAENHEKVLEASRKYHEKNKDKRNAVIRKWQSANRDKMLEIGRRWYEKHQDSEREESRKYRAKHPEKTLQNNRTRRASVKNVGGVIAANEWSALKEKYGFMCLCCGRKEPEIKLHLDHVIPIKLGGKNVIENAQPLCQNCNSRKHIKTTDYRI